MAGLIASSQWALWEVDEFPTPRQAKMHRTALSRVGWVDVQVGFVVPPLASAGIRQPRSWASVWHPLALLRQQVA